NAKWLDGFAKFFEAIVGGFYKIPGTGWIKTLLHGTWPLGHPLHPAITDITIGAYTAAVALDVAVAVTGDLTLTRAADFVLDVAARGLDDRKPVVGKAKDLAVFVVKLDGAIYAIANKCTHAGGPLNEGKWVGNDRCEIQCPWHGSRFCVKDGGVRAGPATFP